MAAGLRNGFVDEAKKVGSPWESWWRGVLRADQITPATVLSGVLLMAYASQSRGQARMQQMILQPPKTAAL